MAPLSLAVGFRFPSQTGPPLWRICSSLISSGANSYQTAILAAASGGCPHGPPAPSQFVSWVADFLLRRPRSPLLPSKEGSLLLISAFFEGRTALHGRRPSWPLSLAFMASHHGMPYSVNLTHKYCLPSYRHLGTSSLGPLRAIHSAGSLAGPPRGT